MREGLIQRVGNDERFSLRPEGEGRGHAVREELRVAWQSSSARALLVPLSPEEQSALDLVSDMLLLDHNRLPRGLEIRNRMPKGARM
jgi:hypothetical protein